MKTSESIFQFFKKKSVSISLAISLFILFFAASNINWGGKNWEDILEADARGYYAYLPATFIYNDYNFDFFETVEIKKISSKNLFYDYRNMYNGKNVNKYFCGTALAEMPFFLIAHTISIIRNTEANGYSSIYFIWINIAAIFYLGLACMYLAKYLRLYNIKESYIAFILPILIFGTNVFLYTVLDPGMSHVYSLAFFSIFIYQAHLYFEKPTIKRFYILAVLMGLIILIRPSNALLVFALPVLAGSFEKLKNGFLFLFQKPIYAGFGILLCIAIVSIQFVFYYIACGKFFVYAYSDERFYLNKPHIIDILFSYRRGLFLYTPILFLSLFGYYFTYIKNKFFTFSHIAFLFLVIYILSTWWVWWYGGGFSGRVFIEFFPFFMLLLAFLLQGLVNTKLQLALKTLLVLLVLVCQIQIYQYRHYHIHWDSTTKEMYWENFLRIDRLF